MERPSHLTAVEPRRVDLYEQINQASAGDASELTPGQAMMIAAAEFVTDIRYLVGFVMGTLFACTAAWVIVIFTALR